MAAFRRAGMPFRACASQGLKPNESIVPWCGSEEPLFHACGFLIENKSAEAGLGSRLRVGINFGGDTPSPSPRSIGIIGLAGKCDLIYGAQSLAGKILMSKNLQGEFPMREAQDGTIRSRRTVTASIMIARLR